VRNQPSRPKGRPITTGDVRQASDGTWYFRYRNLPGVKPARPTVGGFASRAEAYSAYLAKVEEIARLRGADEGERRAAEMKEWNLAQYVHHYLDTYEGAERTRKKLDYLLGKATAAFGRTKLRDLSTPRIRAWRNSLDGARFEAFQALRQVLAQATNDRVLDRNPTDGIRNGRERSEGVAAFASWGEVEAFADEFSDHYRPMIVFGAATGLRPAELLGLQWRDVDVDARRIHVHRALVSGEVRPVKTKASARTVPLNSKAREALDELRARGPVAPGGLVFRTMRGTPIDLHRWRARHWSPAVKAAGLSARPPYALRHTYATLALRSGQSTFEVARWMGTSIAMIDRHYGNLAADSIDVAIDRFDSYVVGENVARLRAVA
jgi:integrase